MIKNHFIDLYGKPPVVDINNWLLERGYETFRSLSWMDHHLDEHEIINIEWFTYKEAVNIGRISDFEKVKSAFLSFYNIIARSGVLAEGQNNEFLRVDPLELEIIVKQAMETDNLRWEFDLYFCGPKVRIIYWDVFTSIMYFEEEAGVELTVNAARECGLHVLLPKKKTGLS